MSRSQPYKSKSTPYFHEYPSDLGDMSLYKNCFISKGLCHLLYLIYLGATIGRAYIGAQDFTIYTQVSFSWYAAGKAGDHFIPAWSWVGEMITRRIVMEWERNWSDLDGLKGIGSLTMHTSHVFKDKSRSLWEA